MMIASVEQKIRPALEQFTACAGIDLIEFRIFGTANALTIRCVVDYPSGGINLSECALLNRKLAEFIEQNNILPQGYALEINSPGLDRRLTNYADFLRVKNKFVLIWLSSAVKGQTYWEGELTHLTANKIVLQTKQGSIELELNNIKVGKQKYV